ncbi:MAG: hypothetical protein Q8S58_15095 [Bosea sp. (in: a-proteobacteria)]|uniref:hypothetical protein n=1 Tax=Bosea sp. (in: a-proteobacteria) TaxID=1871050 RepID=UPI002733D304|nr:hypothetical protein [Bosea sp. (in: a-proteobacteria)]MDP3320450.1 hypothetical protein [Bosea sp. (in: a-proteobacteria)]
MSESFHRGGASDWFDPGAQQHGLAPFPAGQKASARRDLSSGIKRVDVFPELRKHEIEAIERLSAPLFYPEVQEPLKEHEYIYQKFNAISVGGFERVAGGSAVAIGFFVAVSGFLEKNYVYIPLGIALMYAGRSLMKRFAQLSSNAPL